MTETLAYRTPYLRELLAPKSGPALDAHERMQACRFAIREDRCGWAWRVRGMRRALNRRERRRAERACRRCRLVLLGEEKE